MATPYVTRIVFQPSGVSPAADRPLFSGWIRTALPLPQHACAAYDATSDLPEAELFVLVKTVSESKGPETRTISRETIDKPAYRKPLEQRGHSLDEVLDGLVEAELFNPVGTDAFKRTREGNLAAHAYRDFASELGWHGQIPSGEVLSYEYLPEARQKLRQMCEKFRSR